MIDGATDVVGPVWEWIKIVVLAALGILGFNLKTAKKKLEDVENEKLSKDQYNREMSEFKGEMRSSMDRIEHGVNRVHERIDKIKDHT